MTACIKAHEVSSDDGQTELEPAQAATTEGSRESRGEHVSANDDQARNGEDNGVHGNEDDGAAGTAAGSDARSDGTDSASDTSGEMNAASRTDPNAVVPGTICDRLAQLQCEAEQRCCDDPGRDFDACKAAMMGACADELMTDAIAADPITAFNATRARAAFDEIERLASECDPSIATFAESVEGLRGMFAGTLEEGAVCRPDDFLDREMAAASLAACGDPANVSCLPVLLDWTCELRANVGGDCFSDANCLQGLFCNNPDLSLNGSTCMRRKVAGNACVTANECESFRCKDGTCAQPGVQAAYCLL